jgi:hypothetical protein
MTWENTTLNRRARDILLRDREEIEKAQKELKRRKAKAKNIRDASKRSAEEKEIELLDKRLARSLAAMAGAAEKI